MRRVEPNLLLAVCTAFALGFVVIAASVGGPPVLAIRNGLMAIICAGGFVLLNRPMLRMMKITPRPPMIHPQAPGTAVWAMLFPMLVLASAAIPLLLPGPDYGLLVIIASVWFGATVESAIKARAAG